jgi:hypothetical protein
MNQQLICELNLALIPEKELANRLISFSGQMTDGHHSLIRLNGVTPRVAFAPHVTLYQVPMPVRDLPHMRAALREVTEQVAPIPMTAGEYRSNVDEGSFEVRYEADDVLLNLQLDTIAVVNPLRGDLLLERDPAGRPLNERIHESSDAADNIRRTGFDAVGDPELGGLFFPHITLNWFEPGTTVDPPSWPALSDFDGIFPALGIFLLGPYGTCAQRLEALHLAA